MSNAVTPVWTSSQPPLFTVVALAWLDWQLKQDADAARMFEGPDNGLSKRKDWTLEKNRLMK